MTHTICRECECQALCKIANRAPLVFPVIDGSLIQEAQ